MRIKAEARPSPPQENSEEFMAALEAASREIRDPVAKLRFIRESLARFGGIERYLTAVPSAPLRGWLYRWLSLEGLRRQLASRWPSVGASSRRYLWLSRALAGVGLLALSTGLAVAAYVSLLAAAPEQETAQMPAPPPTLAPQPSFEPRGLAPAGIWLVEKGAGWEQYSNGLRIDTSFVVAGEPRSYRVFHTERGMLEELLETPSGILFHTSESDIWPLQAAFNENLRDSSHRLLRYLRRKQVYNYLIDRFGRVFRIVDEGSKANHAGYSVWAHGEQVFLSLNNAFLGVCFETRWEGGLALPITQAQFAAGRNLTQLLRQRWEIPAEMCVAHGLTSVNPRKHLIGHHLDWARGFPFEAFGLPDQYAQPAPAVELFGFGYDDHFLSVLGEPWAGIEAAEKTLATVAGQRGVGVGELRSERQALYDAWIEEQLKDEEARRSLRASATDADGSRESRAASASAGRQPGEAGSAEDTAQARLDSAERTRPLSPGGTRNSGPTRRPEQGGGPRSNGSGG